MRLRLGTLFLSVVMVGPGQEPPPRKVRLSLKQAVAQAVSERGSYAVNLGEQGVEAAGARVGAARSALLPHLEADADIQNFTRSFAAQGLTTIQLPLGLQVPDRIGPINTFDARAGVSTSVLNLGAIGRYRAASAAHRASRLEVDSLKQQVTLQVARQYVAVLRADAEVEAAQANINLSEAILKQAMNQRDAGTATGLEVTRAEVQLLNDRQRMLIARNGLIQATLTLLRTIGLGLETGLDLTDKLAFVAQPTLSLAEMKSRALSARVDLRAQKEKEEAARLATSAVRLERAPSVAAFADYGSAGRFPVRGGPTHMAGVSLKIPVFDGGGREARIAEASVHQREEQIRTGDLQEQIELEIRLALAGLQSAEQEVKTAESGLALAENEIVQARRRLEVGAATSIEVTDAQTRLARARDNRIAALYHHNLARIDLNYAMGAIQEMIQQ